MRWGIPLIRAVALAIVARALVLALHIAWHVLALVALGIWMVAELPFLIPLLIARKDESVSENAWKNGWHGLIEAGLLLALALGYFAIVHEKPQLPSPPGQMTIRFEGDVEKDLAAFLRASSSATENRNGLRPDQPSSNETTIKFDSKLEDALTTYLKRPAGPEVSPISPWWSFAWNAAFLLLILAAIGVVIRVAKDHPSVTPIAVVSGLALAIIHEAPGLPKPGGCAYWLVIGVAGLTGATVLIRSGWDARAKKSGEVNEGQAQVTATVEKESEGKGQTGSKNPEQSPLLVSFSLLLMVLTLAFVAPRVSAPAPTPPPSYEVRPLGEVGGFHSGHQAPTDLTTLNHLKSDDALRQAGTGDILLLVGPADCTPMKSGNQELARNRAEWVLKNLRDSDSQIPANVKIESYAPTQHDKCEATKDVRAVYPYPVPHHEQRQVSFVPRV